MTLRSCPITTVQAPVEQVWRLLADPSRYDLWWEAHTVAIVPPGPAQAGQEVTAYASAAGLKAPMSLTVESVDPERRQIDLLTRLPLGITVHNHITCTPLDERQTRVSFG